MVTSFRLARFINLQKYPKARKNNEQLIKTIFSSRQLHTITQKRGKEKSLLFIENMDEELVRSVLEGLKGIS